MFQTLPQILQATTLLFVGVLRGNPIEISYPCPSYFFWLKKAYRKIRTISDAIVTKTPATNGFTYIFNTSLTDCIYQNCANKP
jgi:hypothetical protein